MSNAKKNNSVYLVSFFEGAAVMATELCGSKILSPFYGSSLFVWASVIAITLGSLAAGYFWGGKLSMSGDKTRKLILLLLSASVLMSIMPLISNVFPLIAMNVNLLPAVVISSLLILALPMLMMGSASPVIISILTSEGKDSGKVSGTVYAISTLGGIISTFISGFWLIPGFGINSTLVVFAVLLSVSLFFFIPKKNKLTVSTVILAVLALGFTSKPKSKNCIYEQDGMLGKINVIDDTLNEQNSIHVIRKLLVNNVVQSEMELASHNAVSDYLAVLDSNISPVKSGKALVLGLGGGLTANLFIKKECEVDGVDLDERIIEVAKKYFYLDERVKTFTDDARHFLTVANKKYDYVLMDLFKAEEQPVHTITLESFTGLKQVLNENGCLIINWHGYLKEDKGLGTCILLNTLKKAGFVYQVCATSNNEDQRNLVIFASLKENTVKKFEINEFIGKTDLLNTDNCPLLEKYNSAANQTWRKNYIRYYYSGF